MPEERKQVMQLLKAYGHDTLSYFHLQHERKYFFSPSGKSCLSYGVFLNVVLISGDPVGPKEEIPLLLETFLQYVTSWHLIPLFIGLSATNRLLVQEKNMKVSKIGEEAILSLATFERRNLKKKVRRAVRHITDSGIEAFFFTTANLPPAIFEQIQRISHEWIVRHGGKEKGFSMTLKRIPEKEDKDCEFVVAISNGEVLGYVCFVPVYGAKSLSLDHMRSKEGVPNGLHEFLIIKSAEYFKENNIDKLSLNFATFTNIIESSRSKLHLRKRFLTLLMRLYKCDSLRIFNNKFKPTWENRYVAYTSLKYLPQYIRAVYYAER